MTAGVHHYCSEACPLTTPPWHFSHILRREIEKDYKEQRSKGFLSDADILDLLASDRSNIADFLPSTQYNLHSFRKLRRRLDSLKWSTDFFTARTIARRRLFLYQKLSRCIKRMKLASLNEHRVFQQRKGDKLSFVCHRRLCTETWSFNPASGQPMHATSSAVSTRLSVILRAIMLNLVAQKT